MTTVRLSHEAVPESGSAEPGVGPLAREHAELGAKFGAFGGWSMPIEYAGSGVLAEYAAVRERVGIFDVSHMGTLLVSGAAAVAGLDAVLTNDITGAATGSAQYNLLCDVTGGVIDDLITYRREGEVVLVPNAGNVDAVAAALSRDLPSGARVTDLSPDRAIIAVQGPLAPAVMAAVELDNDLEYLRFTDRVGPAGEPLLLARTGYTGERGYELIVPVAHAHDWWSRLHAAVTAAGGRAAGLGARDVLRTEMGYPLYGHELSHKIGPVQAGLGWAVAWRKPKFAGRDALLAEREVGVRQRVRALRCTGRGVPRSGMAVRTEHGVGEVTSGTFSPTLRGGIALALLPAAVEIGAQTVIDIRGRDCAAVVVKAPFVSADPRV